MTSRDEAHILFRQVEHIYFLFPRRERGGNVNVELHSYSHCLSAEFTI